jgi:hypothetical protein
MATVQKVTIGNDEYTKSTMEINGHTYTDYRVTRTHANGKKTSGKLNPSIHRYAISRIEAAIHQQPSN